MAKYMERRFVQRGGPSEPHRLRDAIHNRDLLALLQAFAEGHDLAKPLASPEGQVSCVHPKCPPPPPKKNLPSLGVLRVASILGFGVLPNLQAVSILGVSRALPPCSRTPVSWRCTWPCAARTDRPSRWWTSSSRTGASHRVPLPPRMAPECSPRGAELLLALCRGTLDRVTQDGNTALHYGALYNQPNCIKLLLKGKAAFGTGMGMGYGGLGVGGAGCSPGCSPHPPLCSECGG